MTTLWTAADFATALEGRAAGPPPPDIAGISIDSRTVAAGEAFFAIEGERFDGHDFVADAFARGAAAAVVAQAQASRFDPPPGPLVIVPDVLEALRRLARAARARTGATVIGVTGSVGKTGTKEALRLACARSGSTHASAASHNNHWGVPLSLARMPAETRFAIFEMGMNAPGEIAAHTALVRPHIAIITAVAPVHLAYLGSLEAIADAKAEIFSGMETGGTALLNADDAQFDRLRRHAEARDLRVLRFGEADGAAVRLSRAALHADCSCITADVLGSETAYKLGAPGRHLVLNSLAVLGAAKLAGADLALAALGLAELEAPKGRGARFTVALPEGALTVIDESYNANPASMAAALALLGRTEPGKRGRRIAVLGDMLELGPDGPALHRALAGPLAEAGVDLLFAAGPLMHGLWQDVAAARRAHYADTSDGLAEPLLGTVRAGDVVMVKGSLGSRMAPVVEALKARRAGAGAA